MEIIVLINRSYYSWQIIKKILFSNEKNKKKTESECKNTKLLMVKFEIFNCFVNNQLMFSKYLQKHLFQDGG